MATGLAALALAHAPLLTLETGTGDLAGIEQALFEPTGASPGVVLLCWAWLVFVRRERLRAFAGREAPIPGSLLFVLGAALCLWAHYTGVATLLVFSLALLAPASAWLLGGVGAARTLVFPSLFLLLAAPLPTPLVNAVMYPLQLANAQWAGFTLGLLGFEPVVSGDVIFVGDRVFQVIESCSGLRTVFVVLMSTALYVELCWHDRRRSLLLLGLAPIVAIVANHLRILTIIFNPYASISTVHTAQGLVMLVFAIVVIAGLDGLLARLLPTEPALRYADPRPLPRPSGSVPVPLAASFAVLCLSLAVSSLGLESWRPPTQPGVPLTTIRAELPGWQLRGWKPDPEFLGTVRFDAFLAHEYSHPDQPSVRLFLATDHRLDPAVGLASPRTRIPAPGGVPLSSLRPLAAPAPGVEAIVVGLREGPVLVHHWRVGLASLAEELARALLALDRSPFRRAGRAAFVRLSTPIERGPRGLEEAMRRLGRFHDALREDLVKAGLAPEAASATAG